jgi:hypothetical protein
MLKILAGFVFGVPVGMMVMALLTAGKTSDLYIENDMLRCEINRIRRGENE